MFDFFGKLLGYVEFFWDFFITSVNASFEAIKFLIASFGLGSTLMPFMPSIIGTAIVSFGAVFMIRFLLNIF